MLPLGHIVNIIKQTILERPELFGISIFSIGSYSKSSQANHTGTPRTVWDLYMFSLGHSVKVLKQTILEQSELFRIRIFSIG